MRRYYLVPVILAVFALFVIFDYRLGAEDFKIYTGSPGWRGFADVDTCGFDGLRAVGFTDTTLAHNPMGLDLFPLLGAWWEPQERSLKKWLWSSSFWFEAEGSDRFQREMPGFSFFKNEELGGVVGSDFFDDLASNDWARRAHETYDDEGYLVKGLRNVFDENYVDPDTVAAPYAYFPANWFSKQMWDSTHTYKHTNYYAVFWLRGESFGHDGQLILQVRAVHSGQEGPLADDTILVSELSTESYDSILVEYDKYWEPSESTGGQWDTTKAQTDVRVWWNGNDVAWVDRIDIFEEYAWNLLRGVYDTGIDSFITVKYNDPNVKGFQLTDEPRPWQINSNKYCAQYIKSNYQDKLVFTSWAKAFNFYLPYWLEADSTDWFLINNYGINSVLTDTSSDYSCDTCRTLQEAMDVVLAYIDSMRVRAGDREFSYNVPAAEAWDNSEILNVRRPTQWEQEALIWLPLAHGVDVVNYWEYSSYYENCDRGNVQCYQDTTLPWYFYDEDDSLWSALVRGLTYLDTESGGPPPWGDRDVFRYEPHWSVVRRVNRQLHAIGDVLADPNSWIAGFTSDDVPHSWVSSFKSDRHTIDKAYVEIATFEHNDIDYLLLVNRRCLSTEGQNVTVELSGDYFSGNQYYIIGLDSVGSGDDMYYAFIDTTYSAELNGKIPFSTHLAPGQGKFFKIVVAQRKS